jgi:hypothetical protein
VISQLLAISPNKLSPHRRGHRSPGSERIRRRFGSPIQVLQACHPELAEQTTIDGRMDGQLFAVAFPPLITDDNSG